jgi:methionine-gamma-lyase
MEKRIYGREFGFATRAVHTGNDVDGETGAIRRPITMANSYALPYDPSEMNRSGAQKKPGPEGPGFRSFFYFP